jgi:hypothetical protein
MAASDSNRAENTPTPNAAADKPARRRWRFGFRFSLRAFLGAVTIFCILLAWQLHKAKQQREAVAAIRDAGGWVHYDYELAGSLQDQNQPHDRPWEPAWLLELVGIDFFHNVVEVNMVFSEDGPERLDNKKPPVNIAPQLARFPRLRSLLISGNFVDDAGMEQVGQLKRLERFYQWEGQHITDAGAAHLRNMPRLKYIHLGNSQVGDAGLAVLAKLPNLEGLSMQRNRITDAGLAHLAGHPKLKDLWVGCLEANQSPITDAGVVHLATIPQLEELDLQFTLVTPQGLKPLAKLKHLKSLMLSGSTADDLGAVAPLLPAGLAIDARAKPQPMANGPAGQ